MNARNIYPGAQPTNASESSELSLEEAEERSHSMETSSDLSSSVTDDFATQALQISLDKATTEKLLKKVEKKKKKINDIKASDPRGVIYLGHIPYGFFEDQMRKFFSQFGIVTRLRLARNKKTSNSKHYAFVEFLDPVVAKIVADTMDGYMMYHKVLVCKLIPAEDVHPNMFKGVNKAFHNNKINFAKKKTLIK